MIVLYIVFLVLFLLSQLYTLSKVRCLLYCTVYTEFLSALCIKHTLSFQNDLAMQVFGDSYRGHLYLLAITH